MVEKGVISSYENGRARVVVPGRLDCLTLPLNIGRGALDELGNPPPVGTKVVFIEFSDGDGTVFGRLIG